MIGKLRNLAILPPASRGCVSITGPALGAGMVMVASFMLAGPASAISRVETLKTDCAAIRGILVREGAAILRYTSKKGLPIYDRYVSSSLSCPSFEVGVWASIPARDTNSCQVIACRADTHDSDDGFFNSRPLLRITP